MKIPATVVQMVEISSQKLKRLESLVTALREFVDQLRGDDYELTPELRERIDTFRKENRCLFCGKPFAPDDKITRGDHADCYALLHGRVKRGESTMRDIVAKGWINPETAPPGRKRSKRPDPMRNGPSLSDSEEGKKTNGENKASGQTPGQPKRRKPKNHTNSD
jgi:hypothetical protein